MLRSLYSGISGLRAHQTMMDVVGNNIANVNTTGFKSSSTEFEDTLSQLVSSAGRSQSGVGGTNPAQVGLGVKVAGVTQNWTQGSAQLTGRATDMMIQGDGFFVTAAPGGTQGYTRNGQFNFDALGQLTSVDGQILQGWQPDANGNINTNAPVSNITIPSGTLVNPSPTTLIALNGNLASNASVTSSTNLAASPPVITPGSQVGPVRQTVYDNKGTPIPVDITFTHLTAPGSSDGGTWTASMTPVGSTTSVAGTGTIKFKTDGTLDSSSAMSFAAYGGQTAAAGPPVVPAIAAFQTFKLNLSNVTGFAGAASSNTVGGVTTPTATSTATFGTQDGAQAGSISSFGVGSDGTVTATFDNGVKKILGQVALANFANPSGLVKLGNSTYTTSTNSGAAQVGPGGVGGRGTLAAGQLEMSNVDLSQEFTNLIVAQRGFQANSRIITTADQVLQTLVQMGQ